MSCWSLDSPVSFMAASDGTVDHPAAVLARGERVSVRPTDRRSSRCFSATQQVGNAPRTSPPPPLPPPPRVFACVLSLVITQELL